MANFIRRNRPLLITLIIVLVILLFMFTRYEPKVTASVLLSGLTLAALYFLVASGLSLIFGLMDVLNFAHGVLFMIGAYVGYTAYANPRLILNVLPLALAILGGVQAGEWLGGLLPSRLRSAWGERALQGAVWLVMLVFLFLGVRAFNIAALANSSNTAAGGAIPTSAAQEAGGFFLVRIVLLAFAGLFLGLGLSRVGPPEQRQHPRLPAAVTGLALVAFALVLVPLRSPAETSLLALSSNVRFVLALVVGALTGAGLGALIETALIRPLYSRPIYQVLLTLGLGYVGTELVKSVWGPAGFYMDMPAFFNSASDSCPSPSLWAWFGDHCMAIDVFGRPFPSYRLFIIFLGVVLFVALLIVLRRTRLGIIIRAGVQDSEMVQALGINVRGVFTVVFAIGIALAALGGVAAAPFIGLNLGIGGEFLIQSFISVVIGGMGSYIGAAVGALLVGLARAFGDQMVLSIGMSPSIARASTVLIMALVLLLRPAGLFGKRE